MNTYYAVLVCWLGVTVSLPFLGIDPHIVGPVAQTLDTFDQFHLSSFSPSGTPHLLTNLTSVGALLPNDIAYIPRLTSLVFTSITPDASQYITLLTLDGKITHLWKFNVILTNIAYDRLTAQTFVIGFNQELQKNFVFEVDLDAGVLKEVVEVPGIVQVCISAYCVGEHVFYVTVQTADGGNAVVGVDTQKKVVGPAVVVKDAVEIMMWDEGAGVMYAWVATETDAGDLVQLDVKTGEKVKVIAQFSNYSGNGGTAVLDGASKIVYSSLLDISSGSNTPVWVVVDIQNGNHTAYPTSTDLGFPIGLVLIQ
eukprot:TRINITY_DN20588_c0_g2_i1.p1 TRINITY_DN20588_c0_g2~~TRINITY_DN20588_c0_g2_i1.p1  ORF type:complete len:310 (-),score=68.90 TRINITY_DN20588_c0_g2_i1:32-961(-)